MDGALALLKHDTEGAVAPIDANGQKIDEIIRHALTNRFLQTKTEPAGYLDLQFDEGRRHVWRGDRKVDLEKHNLGWALLKVLHEGHGELVPRETIRKVWSTGDVSYETSPEEGTVYGAVSVLRGLLKDLKVGIKRIPKRGYKLVDCP
jgi:DNA-binding response OmpR family regulator